MNAGASSADRDWFGPSLTMLFGLAAVGLATGHLKIIPIATWLTLCFTAFGLAVASARLLRIELRIPPGAIALVAMLAVEPNAYASVKPLLNSIPFTADPALSNFDRVLFGTDPWHLLQWLRPLFGYYFLGWIGGICIAALHLALTPSSPHKTRVILAYFILWSVAGPILHLLIPAGGPIFYDRLGYGDRFAALPVTGEVLHSRDYLWAVYQRGFDGQYAGISAMPSLHVAVATWTALAFRGSPMMPLAIAHAALIFLLSIATGWHYAIDGIAGAALVVGIYATLNFGARPLKILMLSVRRVRHVS